jgi:hypothetical protein
MTFIAETNTDRLHSSVQLHAIYGLISLALGGIAELLRMQGHRLQLLQSRQPLPRQR